MRIRIELHRLNLILESVIDRNRSVCVCVCVCVCVYCVYMCLCVRVKGVSEKYVRVYQLGGGVVAINGGMKNLY